MPDVLARYVLDPSWWTVFVSCTVMLLDVDMVNCRRRKRTSKIFMFEYYLIISSKMCYHGVLGFEIGV